MSATTSTLFLGKAENTPKNYDRTDPWAQDLSGGNRQALADKLTKYFKQGSSSYVVAVHGDWGTGKSFFLQSWADSRLNKGAPCFHFNAWESDHADDAMLAFSYSILQQIEKEKRKTRGYLKKLGLPVVKALTDSLENLPATTVKLAAIGVKAALRCAKIDTEGVAEAFVGDAAHAAKKLQDVFKTVQDARQAVKESITAFAQACHEEGNPLIIMVDELDRCRPSFAVELLENIKHLFSVPHVVFVLALEENQLANCISAVYGLDTVGAKRYLGRFIDMQVRLPQVDLKKYIESYETICPFLDSPLFYDNQKSYTVGDYLVSIFSQFNLSLRDIHQVFGRLSLLGDKVQTPLYKILCGKALVRLQLKDTVENIIELGALPKSIVVNTMPIDPRLAMAVERVEAAIKNNRAEEELVSELKSELNSLQLGEQRGDKLHVNLLARQLIPTNYEQITYRGAQSSQVGKGIFNQYKACIGRDLATVEGIDFFG